MLTRIHRPAPKLISIEKAAELLDVSPSTVRRLVGSRQLKAHKLAVRSASVWRTCSSSSTKARSLV